MLVQSILSTPIIICLSMLNRLEFDIQNHCLILPQKILLVAVSGGPDSLCLLDALWRLGFSLVVAHLDHQLRPSSESEAEIVRQLAFDRGLEFVSDRQDVHAQAEENGLSIEEAARVARYRFLFAQARRFGAQAVAVGHTADDQVETVLMHLLRGAGLSGIKGMAYRQLPNAWSQDITLVRPMLGVWREEILEYLQEQNLIPVTDESNLDTRYYRNRLRHELIPYLENYNPRLRHSIWRMADVLKGDHEVLEMLVDAIWPTCVRQEGATFVEFEASALRSQTIGLQRRILRRGIDHLRPGLRDVDYASLERALRFLEAPSRSRQIDLIAGLRFSLVSTTLWLSTWDSNLPLGDWPQMSGSEVLALSIPGTAHLSGGWQIHSELAEVLPAEQAMIWANADPYQAWLDLDRLKTPLLVRSRRPGDRLQPLGMGGHSVKMSDFMINARLARQARQDWPLVLSGDEIAWIPGFRLGHPFRIRETTVRFVRLELRRKNP
jgi:tRNA(Ile)-lysidine synthase